MRFLLCILLAAVPTMAQALELVIQEDRIFLDARRTPLIRILERFSHIGVEVQADPSIDEVVTGRIEGDTLDDALGKLLQKHSHVLFFDTIRGPLGSMDRLSGIMVFDPDAPDRVQRLASPGDNLDITTGVTGKALFVKDEVLLGFKPGVRSDEVMKLLRELGGTIVSSVPELGIYQVRLPPGTNVEALVAQLEGNPLVARAEPNYAVKLPTPETSAQEGLPSRTSVPVNVAEGVPPVAVLDSGLGSIAGLDQLVVGSLNAMNPDKPADDVTGHGTQMALLATGSTAPAGLAYEGEDEGTPILAVRAFDDNGYASNFGIMRSIDYALKNGSKVLSLSWGSEQDSAFMKTAISYAQSKGMIVVASAGNAPTGKPMYPAAYPGVLGVTGLDAEGDRWEQSNYGSFADVAAPGMASFPIGHNGPPGSYAGTSIGSPFVARQLSMYWARHPELKADEVVEAFKAVLTDKGAEGRDDQFGYGALDADALNRLAH